MIIAPSIVGDRYVQITPVYTGGARLADGATLATDNTSVPLELDQIYSSLNDLNVALGPDGANKNGALTDLLEVTADNFGGQGEQFHQTIANFSQLSQTLEDNKEELFGSAAQLEEFVSTLAQNDTTVRAFNESLSNVSTMLNGEKEELAASLEEPLGRARRGRPRSSRTTRPRCRATSRASTGSPRCWSSSARRSRRPSSTRPIALNNLALTYNPQAGTLDTNANLGSLEGRDRVQPGRWCSARFVEPSDPSGELCDAIDQTPAAGRGLHPGHRAPRATRRST